MTLNPKTLHVINHSTWKRLRNKAVAKAKRSLHIIESGERSYLNKNEDWVRRYDFLMTPAELANIIEDVMRETERQTLYAIRRKEADDAE